MANFTASLELTKLKGAFVQDVKGQTSIKKCLVIPIEDSGLTLFKDDRVFFNFRATEQQQNNYGNSHSIKQQISKEAYKAMSDDERKSIPYIGNMKVDAYSQGKGGGYNNNRGNNNNNNNNTPF